MFDAPNPASERGRRGVGGRTETEGVAEREERKGRGGVMDGVTAAGDTLSLPLHLLREGALVKSALGERATTED